MSRPTVWTDSSSVSRREALSLANAVRTLTKMLPAIEDSSEALSIILRQHSSSLVPLHDELSDLAKRVKLAQQQFLHDMQEIAAALEASASSQETVETQHRTCCVLSQALVSNMSLWKCKAPTAVVANSMLDVMKGMAEPLDGQMHVAVQQLLHATLQQMSSSATCSAEHHCLPVAQASLLRAISFAVGRFPDLQQRSCDMGEPTQHSCMLYQLAAMCLTGSKAMQDCCHASWWL